RVGGPAAAECAQNGERQFGKPLRPLRPPAASGAVPALNLLHRWPFPCCMGPRIAPARRIGAFISELSRCRAAVSVVGGHLERTLSGMRPDSVTDCAVWPSFDAPAQQKLLTR